MLSLSLHGSNDKTAPFIGLRDATGEEESVGALMVLPTMLGEVNKCQSSEWSSVEAAALAAEVAKMA